MAFLTRGIQLQLPVSAAAAGSRFFTTNFLSKSQPGLDNFNTFEPHRDEPRIFTMAPVPLEAQISYASVALLVGHLILAAGLTSAVANGLYQSYRALGPSQDTRERRVYRRHLVPVFALLALLSLATTSSASVQHAILSYRTWASQRDIVVPAK